MCLLSTLAGCESAGSSATRPEVDSLVVPAEPGSYYQFNRQDVERHGAGGERVAVPADLGAAAVPRASGVDPAGGWAAVAYDKRLFSVQLTEAAVRQVSGTGWSSPPSAIGVRGGLIGTVEDGTIGLYRISDGERIWKLPSEQLLRALHLQEIRYVLPLAPDAPDKMYVVGYTPQGTFTRQDIRVLLVDKSAGGAEILNNEPIDKLDFLRACTSDGQHLVLAGEQEEQSISTTWNQGIRPAWLNIVSMDLQTREHRLVVHEALEKEGHVLAIATGYGLAAVSLEGGHVWVYRLHEGSAERVYKAKFTTEVSVACIDESHVVLTGPDKSWSQKVQ